MLFFLNIVYLPFHCGKQPIITWHNFTPFVVKSVVNFEAVPLISVFTFLFNVNPLMPGTSS